MYKELFVGSCWVLMKYKREIKFVIEIYIRLLDWLFLCVVFFVLLLVWMLVL